MNSATQPESGSPENAARVRRNVMFWLLMLMFGFVFFLFASRRTQKPDSIDYSDLTEEVAKGNIASSQFAVEQSTTTVHVVLRDSGRTVKVTIANVLIPDLTEELEKSGVPINFSRDSAEEWKSLALNFAPLIVVVGFWLVILSWYRKKRMPSNP
jgi:ATP-dependent Zn protease